MDFPPQAPGFPFVIGSGAITSFQEITGIKARNHQRKPNFTFIHQLSFNPV